MDTLTRPDVLCIAVAIDDVDQVVATPLRRGTDHNTEMAGLAGCLAPLGVGPVAAGERDGDCCCYCNRRPDFHETRPCEMGKQLL